MDLRPGYKRSTGRCCHSRVLAARGDRDAIVTRGRSHVRDQEAKIHGRLRFVFVRTSSPVDPAQRRVRRHPRFLDDVFTSYWPAF